MKAMILAAGRGTRMLPLTENQPKALIGIQGVPLLEHTIRYLKHFGIDEIIINIHHQATQIIDFIRKNNAFGIRIEFSDETDQLLDTGGGVYKARWFFDDRRPFILTSSDVITSLRLDDMLRCHALAKPLATLAVKQRKSSRDFLFDPDLRLSGWHNNITNETRVVRHASHPLRLAFSTIHIIDPALFELITERGSFSIIDVYLRLAADHLIMGYQHDESLWFECGRIGNLEQLNRSAEIQGIYREFHH